MWLEIKIIIAGFIFDSYLFHKGTHNYTKLDWLLYKWCMKVFNEYSVKVSN